MTDVAVQCGVTWLGPGPVELATWWPCRVTATGGVGFVLKAGDGWVPRVLQLARHTVAQARHQHSAQDGLAIATQ